MCQASRHAFDRVPLPSAAVDWRQLCAWQFNVAWALFEEHVPRLGESQCRWSPAAEPLDVWRDHHGRWHGVWLDPEPPDPPPPTMAWLTWHLGYWWTATLAERAGAPIAEPHEVEWPGTLADAITWLRELRSRWLMVLDGLTDADLARPAHFPWRHRTDRTVAHQVWWVNAELMKNVAEIGQLRFLHAAASRVDEG